MPFCLDESSLDICQAAFSGLDWELTEGSDDWDCLNIAVIFPKGFGCSSYILSPGENAGVKEPNTLQVPVADGVVRDSESVVKSWNQIRCLQVWHHNVCQANK